MMITGAEKGYTTTYPGLAVLAMHQTKCANPLVLVDEIDKASHSDHNGNAVDALLPLLERETSARYQDLCLASSVDASHISWVLTANSLDGLSAPLLSRIIILEIEAPKDKDLLGVVKNMVVSIQKEWGINKVLPDLTETEIAKIIGHYKNDGSLRTLNRNLRDLLESKMWQPPITFDKSLKELFPGTWEARDTEISISNEGLMG